VSFGVFNQEQNKALPQGMKPLTELEVRKAEVLISRANIHRYVGACVEVRETRPRLLLCDKIFRVVFRTPSPILPTYLVEIMRTPHLRHQIESALTGTSPTMKNITKASLLQLQVPVSPPEVQRKIVEMVNEKRARIAEERNTAEQRQSQAAREVEEMILGIRPVG
jgi:type I restriction enzyme S subunit